ncbi:MAG: hypothetical protein L0Y72_10240 [Gemmataceae bacterium]|nr:hypothetical protein [Gemmataceae bacterium]
METLEKAVRQAAKAASFKEASEDLAALLEVSFRATHLQRLSERVGKVVASMADQSTNGNSPRSTS